MGDEGTVAFDAPGISTSRHKIASFGGQESVTTASRKVKTVFVREVDGQ